MKLNLSKVRGTGSGYTTNAERVKGALKAGAAGAGAGAAAAFAYSEIKTLTTSVQSVTETWKEPIYQDKNLGSYPNVGEVHSKNYGWSPTLDSNGHALLQEKTETFSGHGAPVVHWNTHTIQDPYVDPNNPVHHWTTPIYTYIPVGKTIMPMYSGEAHHYEPNMDYRSVNSMEGQPSYQTPDVHFENGVNTALNTALGAIGGFVLAGLWALIFLNPLSRKGFLSACS